MASRQAFAASEASVFDNIETGQRPLLVQPINEALFRAHDDADAAQGVAIICECTKPDCRERVTVTRDDCEEVRRFPTRFVLRLDHLVETTGRLVAKHDGVAVVEK